MCVIVYKPKYVDLPSESILRTCSIMNGDGIGYTFVSGKDVVIKKGYMNFEDFYKDLLEDYKKSNLKKHNLIIHFRIGTSGGLTKEKTQPFKISNSIKELNKIYVKNKKASLVHNGILHDFTYDAKNSDTQNYIKDFLQPLLESNIKDKSKLIKASLEETSKIAILDHKDRATLYGDFIKYNGVYYSNNSFNYYTNAENSIKYNFTAHERKEVIRYDASYLDKFYNYNGGVRATRVWNYNSNTKKCDQLSYTKASAWDWDD